MACIYSWARRLGVAVAMGLWLAGCGGGGTSEFITAQPAQPSLPESSVRFLLAAATPAPAPTALPAGSAGSTVIEGRLDAGSQQADSVFRYDTYVVTAVRSGTVTVTSAVLESVYRNGYGFPISMGSIHEGAKLQAYGGNYEQDALASGIAVTKYSIEEGRQYLLVYKTFESFVPLRYSLNTGDGLRVEGRIVSGSRTGDLPADPGGSITIANPRERILPVLIEQIAPVLQSR